MDEPTAALTRDETERLLETVRALAAAGTAIVLVSHYLEEVLERLRDGHLDAERPADPHRAGRPRRRPRRSSPR